MAPLRRVEADPWMAAMTRGDFARAWTIADGHPGVTGGDARLPRHEQRIWDGRDLTGQHVLVRCYHGLGDTIQFVRYADRLRAIAREVTLWAQADLIGLLASKSGLDRVLPLHDGTPDIAYDVDVEVMELPHVFRTTIATIPATVPYLRAAQDPPPRRSGAALEVGVAWRGGIWAPARSMTGADMAGVLGVPGVAYVPLVRDPSLDERRIFGPPDGVETMSKLAARVSGLDLVITVDTMVAHLAGALGVPTWLMLGASPDWRWMADRSDSPWYPRARLYRRARAERWPSLVARVRADLQRLREGW